MTKRDTPLMLERIEKALEYLRIAQTGRGNIRRDISDAILWLEQAVKEYASETATLAKLVDHAEVIGNVTEALLDLDATYDGNRVTFTFLSTNDAMSHIYKARKIVAERLSMIRAACEGMENADR